MTATLTTHDLSNNDSVSTGIARNSDGTFTALTRTQGKEFKTESGAARWLAARGYAPNGVRL